MRHSQVCFAVALMAMGCDDFSSLGTCAASGRCTEGPDGSAGASDAATTDAATQDAGVSLGIGGFCNDAGWCWENPLPQGNTLHDIWGSDAGIWTCGEVGTLMFFDGGSWTQYPGVLDPGGGGTCAIAGDGTTVWVSDGESVARWTGSSWLSTPSPAFYTHPYEMKALPGHFVLSGDLGGGGAALWRNDDGGWVDVTPVRPDGGPFPSITGLAFPAPNDIWIVTGGELLEGDGTVWNTLSTPDSGTFSDVAVFSSGDVWLVGSTNPPGQTVPLYAMGDAGGWTSFAPYNTGNEPGGGFGRVAAQAVDDVWATVVYSGASHCTLSGCTTDSTLDAVGVFGLYAASPEQRYASGLAGTVFQASGSSWAPLTSGVTLDVRALARCPDGTLYASGAIDTALLRTDAGWLALPGSGADPNTFMGVACSFGGAWVVGTGGLIYPLTPAGLGTSPVFWTLPDGGDSSNVVLTAVRAAPDGTFYAVGTGGVVLREQGGVWTALAGGAPGDLSDVWAVNGIVVAVGGSEVSFIDPDGGVTSSTVLGDGGLSLSGVWASGPNDVWTVDSRGVGKSIWHFDGGSWLAINPEPANTSPPRLYAIWGTGQTDVWVGAQGSVLYHGPPQPGFAWSRQDLPSNLDVYAVVGGGSRVWAGGAAGMIFSSAR